MTTNIKLVPDIPEGYNISGKVFMIHDVNAPSNEDTKRIPANFFIPTIYEEKTYSEASALISGGTVRPGVLYKITDRGDSGIFLEGIATNAFSRTGLRLMLCPAYYGTGAHGGNEWIGVWNSTKTPAVGDLAIWGGLVWKNLTGDIGSMLDSYGLDETNWEVIPKASFENGEYLVLTFGVLYDFANNWIERQWDGAGNELGCNKFMADYNSITINPVDVSDWNMATNSYPFFGNRVLSVSNNSNQGGIFNNSGGPINENLNNGDIDHNQTLWGIVGNSNNGYIQFNRCGDIQINSNDGEIFANILAEGITENTNDGAIQSNRVVNIVGNFSPVGIIRQNILTGGIYGNTCNGVIEKNSNNGDVRYNSINGGVYENSNNGHIAENTSLDDAAVSIFKNVNNGHIGVGEAGTDRTGDITDTAINK